MSAEETKNNFSKSFLILITGSFFSQIINFITAPVMTRLFSVNDIGVFSLILTIVTLLSPILNGRYELSIISAKRKKDIYILVKISIYFCFILSCIFSLILMKLFFYNIEIYKKIFFIIPFLLFIYGYSNVANAYNNRFAKYKLISQVNIIKSFSFLILIIISSIIDLGAYGLLLSLFFSYVVPLKKQSEYLCRKLKYITKIPFCNIKRVFLENKKMLFYSVPAAFMNSLSYSATNFCIEDLYGLSTLGYYSLTFRALGVPLTLISTNVSKVFFEQASKEFYEQHTFFNTFLKGLKILLLFAVPLTIFIYFASPILCSLFFGESWIIAGEYMQILAIMFAARFIVAPLSVGILIIRKNTLEILGQFLLVLNLLFVYCYSSLSKLDIKEFLEIYSCGNTIIYLLWLITLLYYAKRKF